jgi:hypothetical protein
MMDVAPGSGTSMFDKKRRIFLEIGFARQFRTFRAAKREIDRVKNAKTDEGPPAAAVRQKSPRRLA